MVQAEGQLLYASRSPQQLTQPLYPFTPSSPSITPSRSRLVCPIPPIKKQAHRSGPAVICVIGNIAIRRRYSRSFT
ncbi:hypothetical protein KLNKPBOH_00124 [Aeromonas veronii]